MASLFQSVRRHFYRLSGKPVVFDLDACRAPLAGINARAMQLATADDHGLRAASERLKARARAGASPDDLLADAYALVREAARRALGLDPFDVQIMAGVAMHRGHIAEMQTGEGKTLAAVFPAYLHALAGRGVHVLTFNDYLARRDAAWMGPAYRLLGTTVGSIHEGMPGRARRQAYAADVTYATAKETGFDFLRDYRCYDPDDQVHRPFYAAIVDEADSILIDEARVPLVIAGSTAGEGTDAHRMAAIARLLQPDVDFQTDAQGRNMYLTEAGINRVQALLGCDNLHAPENLQQLTDLHCALHARVLLQRDVDYIVRGGRIDLVDEFTGRVADRRHWPDGLQAALEAKERLRLQPEGTTLGTITLQHFIKLYPRVCGMTATARPAARELFACYGLRVVVIPPNRPCIRIDHPDVIFTDKEAKNRALIAEITRAHETGRPVLVGTGSVAESEDLAAKLQQAGVPCRVLNAKNDALEALIIARAGAVGAVTISTNMAGRGTDIKLGGDLEQERDRVVGLGGLYVLGTHRHKSLRIDQQLRGRAGRQGDPGASRFFISLEDPLLVQYGIRDLIPKSFYPQRQEAPLDNPLIRREIARAQRIVEGQHFDIRKTLITYSSFIEAQRQAIAQRRAAVLSGEQPLQLLKTQAPARYARHRAVCGEVVLQHVERQITLFHIDRCWAQHLAEINHIREGIHLVSLGGQQPFFEFQKRAAAAFEAMLSTLDGAILDTFQSIRISETGADLDRAGLKGPASTWTYLVHDDALGDELARLTVGYGNTAFAAGAVLMTGPLLFAWSLYRYFKSRKDGPSEP